ncbi:hypothetical protein ACN4EK_32310 [Pantanalinema rosaneae CENA516]|uniref:hypothetical protein n=1 Tax=Pantanalinema rosaneae TaxID=1620701 RepID=UPI003D7008D7
MEALPVTSRDAGDEGSQPTVNSTAHGLGPHPFSKILGRMIGRPLIGLDARDAGLRAPVVGDRGREQADTAVEVEVVGPRIETVDVNGLLHGQAQHARSLPVHLPESGVIEPKLALTDALDDHRGSLFAEHQPGFSDTGRENVNCREALEALCEGNGGLHLRTRERSIRHRNDGVRAGRHRSNPPVGVDV